jgi:hypothetical protein
MPFSPTPDSPPSPIAVVVAHPDDECLWLSSVLASADRVVLCFGDLFERPKKAAARRRAVAALPLPNLVNLKIPESAAGFSVDWEHPQPTQQGMAIIDPVARARYEANFPRLIEALRPVLAGFRHVCTHNPWGEYGHGEHVQVYRAVAALQAELGYTIWFSNYASAKSWTFAHQIGDRPCWGERRTLPTNRAMGRGLMRVYVRSGAWTWTLSHLWPAEETLYSQPPQRDPMPRHSLIGEWLLDVAGLRWWPPFIRTSRRRLD